jgi:D-amino peptidase
MVGDVNAAIEGILSVSQAEITVSDGHGGMNNIDPEALNPEAILVRGRPKPQSQMAGLDQTFDVAIFIGYHSMKGTYHGSLSHTYSGGNVESLHINDLEVGETAMNAGIAGYYGVPLILVAGDLAVTEEVKALNPRIRTVVTKEAISRVAAKCLHPQKSRELIKSETIKAIEDMESIKPFVFPPPVTFRIRFTDAKRADAASFMPSTRRLDGKTVVITQSDYIKAYHGFLAAVMCATSVS